MGQEWREKVKVQLDQDLFWKIECGKQQRRIDFIVFMRELLFCKITKLQQLKDWNKKEIIFG